MKADALSFSWAGDKYIGRSYEEMDCQAFVEKCLEEVGIRKDLKGSNAWWRVMTWTGTPEECVRIFGSVPKGAFLFILKDDGGEVSRGYHDGKGNASHIGIKTGRGKGAIHSSVSRGHVDESEFHDKTIRNGGWNRVGLWDQMDYGKTVNWLLEHIGIGGAPADQSQEEDNTMMVTVTSLNGKPVNLRKAADKGAALVDQIPDGTKAELLSSGEEWSKIKAKGKIGWMMTEFLVADDSALPAEDFDADDLGGDQDGSEAVQLTFTVEELSALLPVLEKAVDQIVAKVGRG